MKISDKFKLVFRVIPEGNIKLLKTTNGCILTDFDIELIENTMSCLLKNKIDTGRDRFIGDFDSHINAPEYAVHFCLTDYTVDIIKGDTDCNRGQAPKEIIKCPKCGRISDWGHCHGDTYQCGGCKIRITTYGNSLYLYY